MIGRYKSQKEKLIRTKKHKKIFILSKESNTGNLGDTFLGRSCKTGRGEREFNVKQLGV